MMENTPETSGNLPGAPAEGQDGFPVIETISAEDAEASSGFESDILEPAPAPSPTAAINWGTVREVIETVLLALVLFLGINLITARVRVDGHSMDPTLQNGEIILVNRLTYRFAPPQRGDIIVFHFPGDPNQEYIKRIIGLPGDTVVVKGGKVYVNNVLLDETYIQDPPDYALQMETPENALLVLGDNRNNSSDSHSWGTLDMKYVVGKAVFIYWPFERWGWVPHADLLGAATP